MLLTDHFIEGLGADAIREGCCHGRYLLGMGLWQNPGGAPQALRLRRSRRAFGRPKPLRGLACGAPVLKAFLLLLF